MTRGFRLGEPGCMDWRLNRPWVSQTPLCLTMRCYGGVDGNEEAAGTDTLLQGWSRNSGLLMYLLKASCASECAIGRSRPLPDNCWGRAECFLSNGEPTLNMSPRCRRLAHVQPESPSSTPTGGLISAARAAARFRRGFRWDWTGPLAKGYCGKNGWISYPSSRRHRRLKNPRCPSKNLSAAFT